MTDLTDNTTANLGKYANLITVRDLIKQYPDHLYQGSWYFTNRYCFAGFAVLVKEGKAVGEVIPNQDPYLAEWLGLTPGYYNLICYSLESSSEVIDAIDAIIEGRPFYDSEGFDSSGHDQDGYDADGYDRQGFDANGYDADGYDENGYDADGYDENGYDADGYDPEGYDGSCYNREGFDCRGFDRKGFDAEGYNWDGYDRAGYDRSGLDSEGRERDYPF
jgi:hypothetical protein